MAEAENKISAEEAAEFAEFKKSRREAEYALALGKLVADASMPMLGDAALKGVCESAKRCALYGVLVSPVRVAAAKKLLGASGVRVLCLAGGTGESLPAVKRAEVRRAVRQGAREIYLFPCRSALAEGREGYLKREVKSVRRAAKKAPVMLVLGGLPPAQVALGARTAREGGAEGVCVRQDEFLSAVEGGAGRLRIDALCAESVQSLEACVRMGAVRVCTPCPEHLTELMQRELLSEPPAALKK